MAALLGNLGMLVGSVGIFPGFFHLSTEPATSLQIVTLTTVGVVGVLSFIRHVVFHKSDAARLGWQTDRPDWMFEVGFANLSFGLMGMVTACLPRSSTAQAVVLSGYSCYLFQAALLHGYRYFTETAKSPSRLWRCCIATLLYALAMAFFATVGFALD